MLLVWFLSWNGWLLIVAFVLFQKRDDARQFMKFLHPDLGVGNTHFQNGSFIF